MRRPATTCFVTGQAGGAVTARGEAATQQAWHGSHEPLIRPCRTAPQSSPAVSTWRTGPTRSRSWRSCRHRQTQRSLRRTGAQGGRSRREATQETKAGGPCISSLAWVQAHAAAQLTNASCLHGLVGGRDDNAVLACGTACQQQAIVRKSSTRAPSKACTTCKAFTEQERQAQSGSRTCRPDSPLWSPVVWVPLTVKCTVRGVGRGKNGIRDSRAVRVWTPGCASKCTSCSQSRGERAYQPPGCPLQRPG